jgi:hypothetical protein
MIIISIIVGAAALVLSFKLFFDDFSEFLECVKFWIKPEIFSLFRGEYFEDIWAEMKLGIWLLTGGGAGYGTYLLLQKIFS